MLYGYILLPNSEILVTSLICSSGQFRESFWPEYDSVWHLWFNLTGKLERRWNVAGWNPNIRQHSTHTTFSHSMMCPLVLLAMLALSRDYMGALEAVCHQCWPFWNAWKDLITVKLNCRPEEAIPPRATAESIRASHGNHWFFFLGTLSTSLRLCASFCRVCELVLHIKLHITYIYIYTPIAYLHIRHLVYIQHIAMQVGSKHPP